MATLFQAYLIRCRKILKACFPTFRQLLRTVCQCSPYTNTFYRSVTPDTNNSSSSASPVTVMLDSRTHRVLTVIVRVSRTVTTVVPVAHRYFLKMCLTRYRLLQHECLAGQRLSFRVCLTRYEYPLALCRTLYTQDMHFMHDMFHILSVHHVSSRMLHHTRQSIYTYLRLYFIRHAFFSPTPYTVSHRRYLMLFYMGNEIHISDAYSSLLPLASMKGTISPMPQ